MELLTVIAIIGILAAIIIPVTGRVRESARVTRCASNLRQIGQAMLLYTAEDRQSRFPAQTANTVTDAFNPASAENWIRAIAERISMKNHQQSGHIFYCPNTKKDNVSTVAICYAMNRYLAGKPMSALSAPTRIILLRHTRRADRTAHLVDVDKKYDPVTDLDYADTSSGNYNYLFADGHVALKTPLLGADYWNPES